MENEDIHQDNLLRPSYTPKECSVGVVHVGVGAFHRAHQAMFFDQLLRNPAHQNWGIAGVNLVPQDAKNIQKLASRDNRYVLKTVSADGVTKYQEIASILKLVDFVQNPEQATDLLADDNIQLVTMTVTESGYYLLPNGKLDIEKVTAEVKAKKLGGSIYKYLRRGLNKRREHNGKKITLLSCDNLRHNGNQLKSGFTQYLEYHKENELLNWIQNHVTFPCSMVDRITPMLSAEHALDVKQKFQIEDDATVMAEDFVQWVVEDNFAGTRPPLDEIDVQLCANVQEYEEVKIRILNASHVAIAMQAANMGIEFIDQAVTNKELSEFFDNFIETEAIPALGEDGPIDKKEYSKKVKERFANANIRDTVERVCLHGAEKIKIFIVPTVKRLFEQGQTPKYALTAIASWYVMMKKFKDKQINFEYHDPHFDMLEPYLAEGKEFEFASLPELWGELPSEYPEFSKELTNKISQLSK